MCYDFWVFKVWAPQDKCCLVPSETRQTSLQLISPDRKLSPSWSNVFDGICCVSFSCCLFTSTCLIKPYMVPWTIVDSDSRVVAGRGDIVPFSAVSCLVQSDWHGCWRRLWCDGCDGFLLWCRCDWVLDADVGQTVERSNGWGSLAGVDPSSHLHTRLRVTHQGKIQTKSLDLNQRCWSLILPSHVPTHTKDKLGVEVPHENYLYFSNIDCNWSDSFFPLKFTREGKGK